MKTNLKTFVAAMAALSLACLAHALPITPLSGVLNSTRWEGNQTAQPQIDAAIAGFLGTSTELYKQNVGGGESGALAGSYNTVFTPTVEPSGALITYTGGPVLGDTRFMLVKDGNQQPAWYLFNLTALGWNGTEDLVLSGFWPGNGAISHVTLYGGTGTSVPDGGATMALLGLSLLCVEGLRRKMKRA